MEHYYNINETPNFKDLVEYGISMQNEVKQYDEIGNRKTMVCLFFNPSLRTRISTQKAGIHLGLEVISMNAGDGYQLEFEFSKIMNENKAEHVKEAAGVLSQYADIIAIRSFPGLSDIDEDLKDKVLKGFMKYATVPILNMESSLYHPLQALADTITIESQKNKKRPKVVLSWAPHIKALPLAVPISFAQAMSKMDYDFQITHPNGHELPEALIGKANIVYDQEEAFENADFIYAKSWSSTKNYGLMHCLPIRRNVVASDDVLDSEDCIVLKQAKNRVLAAQSAIYSLLK
jgi:N-succinyl-L-ornithine transcarbamylase